MASTTTVRLDDLRAGLLAVLDQVERTLGVEIDLAADYYWDIGAKAAFEMSSEPTPGVGQLSDDVDELRELVSGRPDRPVIVSHDLAHLQGILQRLARLDLPE